MPFNCVSPECTKLYLYGHWTINFGNFLLKKKNHRIEILAETYEFHTNSEHLSTYTKKNHFENDCVVARFLLICTKLVLHFVGDLIYEYAKFYLSLT